MIEDIPFIVEEELPDGSGPFEILARCANATIGQAAFAAAVKMRPNARIILRHGARVIEKHIPK